MELACGAIIDQNGKLQVCASETRVLSLANIRITDLACMSQSLFTVSLYDTLGPDTTQYIINPRRTELRSNFADACAYPPQA